MKCADKTNSHPSDAVIIVFKGDEKFEYQNIVTKLEHYEIPLVFYVAQTSPPLEFIWELKKFAKTVGALFFCGDADDESFLVGMFHSIIIEVCFGETP